MDTEHTPPQLISVPKSPMRNIRRGLIVLTVIFIAILLIAIPIIESLEKQGWTSYPENPAFWDLTYDNKGNLWAGTDNGLFILGQDGKWIPHKGPHNSGTIFNSIFDEKGNLWIGGDEDLSMMTSNGKWTTYTTTNSGLISHSAQVLAFDQKGNLWIGGYGGLSMLAPNGKWTTYSKDNSGLNSDDIYALAFDKKGNLWVGGYDGLCMLAPDGKWTRYPRDLTPTLALTFDKKGNLWIGTSSGLRGLNPAGNWRDYSTFTIDPVYDIIFDKNDNLWAATGKGLSILTPDGQWTTYTTANSGLRADFARTLVFDKKGNLWIGTDSGVTKLDPNGIRPINYNLALHRARTVINVLLISAIFFLMIAIIWPFILVKKVFTKSVGEPTTASVDSSKPAIKRKGQRSWKQWILPIAIALIIAFSTIWGALFFFAIVWLLRMDSASDASFIISDNEKKTARRVYTWLFFSPVLTIPLLVGLLFNASYESTPSLNQIFLAILISALPHTLLLFGLTSKSVFVYRHTQQGILLVALRTGMAALAINSLDSDMSLGLGIFFLGNGLLWLFGSLIGWSQVSHGESWFMNRKGETPITSDAIENLPAQKHIEQSQGFIHRYKPEEAKKHALAAFRSGDREIKAQAIKLLNTLDEVEKF